MFQAMRPIDKLASMDGEVAIACSWVIGFGAGANGGNTDDVQIEGVLRTVELILNKSGSITLEVTDGAEIGPQSLQVEAEGGMSVISLGENTLDDYIVRSFTNKFARGGTISILGNEWDLKLVCEDSALVKHIVKEFLSTGDVSKDLLN